MTKPLFPANYLNKHISKNPVQKFLIKRFYSAVIDLAKPLFLKTLLDMGCEKGLAVERLSRENIEDKIEELECSKNVLFRKK